jgi:hypothetical protein
MPITIITRTEVISINPLFNSITGFDLIKKDEVILKLMPANIYPIIDFAERALPIANSSIIDQPSKNEGSSPNVA